MFHVLAAMNVFDNNLRQCVCDVRPVSNKSCVIHDATDDRERCNLFSQYPTIEKIYYADRWPLSSHERSEPTRESIRGRFEPTVTVEALNGPLPFCAHVTP